jgi:glycine/D-amino acid oxidase-like deaminating enzyme
MSPPVRPVTASARLPARVDVVVVGGGIVGVSAAWFLTKQGLRVALCEKGVIAGEQSSRNWGLCRQQGRDPRELPLAIEALRIWRNLDAEIEEKTGFAQTGIMYIAGTENELAKYEAWMEHAQLYQLDTRLLGPEGIKEILPDLQTEYAGALWTPSDGRAEPSEAAPAIATAAIRHGAAVLTGCAVRGLETSAGRVSAVVTERGTIQCDAVLLAGGAWSSLLLKRHDITFPQLKVRSSVMRTTAGPEVTLAGIWSPDFGLRRRSDGKYTLSRGGPSTVHLVPDTFRWMGKFWNAFIVEREKLKYTVDGAFFRELFQDTRWALDAESPFEKSRILDPPPDHELLDKALVELKECFPVLRDLETEERWAGMVDVTPDALPCIAPMEQMPGLYLASGFSGHGFGIGPGAGKLAAEMVAGAPTCVDLAPFRYTRFFDGTSLSPDSL